jgi:hypothetical protein
MDGQTLRAGGAAGPAMAPALDAVAEPGGAPRPDEGTLVAVYATHGEAEAAVKVLQRNGFDMRRLSIVGRGYHSDERVVGYYNAGDRVRYWGKWGAFWGGLTGVLFGSALLFVPVVGHVIVLGPLVSALANGVAGAAATGGATAIGAALYSIGIPKDSVVAYEAAVRADRFLLVAHGTRDEARRAGALLAGTGAEGVDVHGAARDAAGGH